MKKKNKSNRRMVRNDRMLMILLVLFAIVIVGVIMMIPDTGVDTKAIYGDRLEGINKVKITKAKRKEVIDNLNESGKVKKVNFKVQGKIINLDITLNDDVSRDDAKSLADKVSEKLSDDEKKFYDIQLFIQKDVEDNSLPIIGYKHHAKDEFKWTLDR